MSAPNIVNIASLYGKTVGLAATTSELTLVSNAAASNKVFKINTVIVANIDGVNNADVTVNLKKGATAYKLANTVTVPADATLIVISKDTAVYLEENDSISVIASANGDLEVVCSYEEIA